MIPLGPVLMCKQTHSYGVARAAGKCCVGRFVPSTVVVWNPLCLDPSDGVFGRPNLAAFCGLPHLQCLSCYVHSAAHLCMQGADSVLVPAGHQSDVDVLAWHPNSHYLTTGSADRTVRLWDVRDGQCCRLLSAQTGCITCLAFAPDGNTLAAGTDDGSISIYDVGNAKRMALLEGHVGPVWSCSFSKGAGTLLATGGADQTVRVWSMPSSESTLVGLVTQLGVGEEGGVGGEGEVGGAGGAAVGAGGGGVGAVAAAGAKGAHGWQGSQQQHQQQKPYQLLRTYRTRATPVIALEFSPRNLLLAGGPVSLTYRA